MGETISINSLLLMLAAGLLYSPALEFLLPFESRSQSTLIRLLKAAPPFACACWFLAYFWGQELRSTAFSVAAIACLFLLLLPVGYRLLSPVGSPKLAWLLRTQVVLLAYAAGCWAVMSLAAETTGATVESQTLVLGYLLLAPTLAWALLPRPRAPQAGLFVVLSGLLAYAIAAWATLAFWGVFPPLASRLDPVLAAISWLLVLGVLAWVLQLLLRTPAGSAARRSVVRAVASLRRLPSTLLTFIRTGLPALQHRLRLAFVAVGRLVAAGPAALWSALRRLVSATWRVAVALVALVAAIGFAVFAFARRAWAAAVWLATVAPKSAARSLGIAVHRVGQGLHAAGRAAWQAFVGPTRTLRRATIWSVTVMPGAAVRGMWAALRAAGRGLAVVSVSLLRLLVAVGRGIGRAAVWFATQLPGLAAGGLLAARHAISHEFTSAVEGAWRALRWLGLSIVQATGWLVKRAPRLVGRAAAATVRAFGHGMASVGLELWTGLAVLASTIGRAIARLAITVPNALGRSVLAATRALKRGSSALAFGTRHAVRSLAAVVAGAALWLVTTAPQKIGRTLANAAVADWLCFRAAVSRMWVVICEAVHGLSRALAWPVVVGLPALAHALVVAARATARGAVWLVAVGVPSTGRGISRGVQAAALGFLGLVLGIARLIVAFGRGLVHAPGRFVALGLALGRALVYSVRAGVSGVLALVVAITAGFVELFTQVIPGFARRLVAGWAASLSRARAGLRFGVSYQLHVRPRAVLYWGVGLFIAAAAATWLSRPPGDEAIATMPSPTPLPPNAIGISIVTNDTKAEWLGIVTDTFNKKGVKTSAGHDIIVQMIQESSPEPTVKKIVAGELQPIIWSPADISWVEQANALLQEQGKSPVVNEACPRIVYAPTGFMMWRPMAEALGWPDKPIGWQTIVDLAADPQGWAKYGHPDWGQFKFGHTHPEQSSTGFTMLATLAYAAAGKTEGLTPEDVWSPAVVEAFRKVERDTYHYGTSTKGLSTIMATRGPAYLHAMTATEVSMMKTTEVQKEVLRFPLAFIFPSEGVFWMDNPACLLDASWVSAEQREAANLYRDYLLGFEAQDKAVQIGLRPLAPNVPLHSPISLASGTDPRVSPQTLRPLENVSAATHQAIIDAFKLTKKPASVVLVLDTSNSMAGERIRNAVAATRNFIGRLRDDDRVQVYTFNNQVARVGPYGAAAQVRDELGAALSQLRTGGQTALNDAICAAVRSAEEAGARDRAAGEQRLYGVVVLSDGAENRSKQGDVFECLPEGEDVEGVKVSTIAYGNQADAGLLKKIAERTNGKAFKADPATIEQVYLYISAEQ